MTSTRSKKKENRELDEEEQSLTEDLEQLRIQGFVGTLKFSLLYLLID